MLCKPKELFNIRTVLLEMINSNYYDLSVIKIELEKIIII